MPTFEFHDHVEPVIVKIGDDEYRAMPGIPANDFAAFMEVFSLVPPLIDKLRTPDTEETKGAQMAAYLEFINVSMRGLDLVMQPESIERIKVRASDKERPIEATLLANVFSTLAAYYMSGGQESEEAQGAGPTVGGNELSPSSDTTGGSSEDSFSSEAPLSTDGTTTT